MLRKIARNPDDKIHKQIEEIEQKLCQENFQMATAKMKAQLSLAAKSDTTNGASTSWRIYRKLRPRHKPVHYCDR